MKKHKNSSGFTLVEIVIALGIVSFAFVAVLGMLPVGINAFSQAMDSTVQAQIAQRLFSDTQQMKFSDLEKITSPVTYYYDAQGNELESDQGFVYCAVVNVPSEQITDNSHLKAVTIDIAKNHRDVAALKARSPSLVKTFSFTVANIGI